MAGTATDPRTRYRDSLRDLFEYYDVDASAGFVDVDGPVDTVHYVAAGDGDGDPVVFFHGAATQGSDWIPLLPDLTEYRCLVFERPGHGRSPAFDHQDTSFRAVSESLTTGFLDALGLDSASLVGNSFGGYHALAYAASNPSRVDSLAVVGTPAGITRDVPFATRLFGVPGLNRLWYRLTRPGDVDDARDIYERINVADASALPEAFFRSYVAATRVPGRRETLRSQFEGIVGLRGASRSFLLREELPSIEAPTRFVWGDSDYFGSVSLGREVAAEMDADFFEVDAAGHMPWLEPDPAVAPLLIDFLP